MEEAKMISITEIQNITEHCMKILSCTEYLRRDEATKEVILSIILDTILKKLKAEPE